MTFFNGIYDKIVDGLSSFLGAAHGGIFVFIALCLFVLALIVHIIFLSCDKDLIAARKIRKIRKIVSKSDPDAQQKVTAILTKGKGVLQANFASYSSDPSMQIREVFNNQLLHTAKIKTNVIHRAAIGISILLFVMLMATGADDYGVYVVPGILYAAGFLLGMLFAGIQKAILNRVVSDCAHICANIIFIFGVRNATVQAIPQAQTNADGSMPIVPITTEEEFATALAKLMEQKDILEGQIESERKILGLHQKQADKEIKATEKELAVVRGAINQSDDSNAQKALKAQEANQLKLIEVLEKLKAAQQRHYDDAERKLHNEMEKIEQMIATRKARQQMAVAQSLNQYGNQMQEQATMPQQPAQDITKTEESIYMNSALTDLLDSVVEDQDNNNDKMV